WAVLYLCFVRQTDGRDKAMKLVQYSLKVLLWLALHRPRDARLRKRLSALVSAFSSTRKMIRLTHWVEPLKNLVEWSASGVPITLGVLNDFFDDVYCLCRIKCLPKRFEHVSERWSLWCWYIGLWIDLHSNLMDQLRIRAQIRKQTRLLTHATTKQSQTATLTWQMSDDAAQCQEEIDAKLATLREKEYWLRVSGGKLLGDFAFCTYDLFNWSFSDGWPAMTGLASGVLSSHKLWVK
ncbi:peroxisomal biogenesis factor 11, partial [Thamnocephalis sphaerospora]